MKVETYEVEGLETPSVECAEEHARMVEALGLSGQRKFHGDKDDAPSLVPYRQMSAEEEFAYGVLCPRHIELEKFEDSPIPLRVLQIAEHARSLRFFSGFEVWAMPVGQPDPVLVGLHNTDPVHPWMKQRYILARWGEALDEFPVLLERAAKRWKDKARETIRAALKRAQSDLDEIDSVGASSLPALQEPYYRGLHL